MSIRCAESRSQPYLFWLLAQTVLKRSLNSSDSWLPPFCAAAGATAPLVVSVVAMIYGDWQTDGKTGRGIRASKVSYIQEVLGQVEVVKAGKGTVQSDKKA